MLLFCLEEEIIDDEEFAVLYEEYMPQNLPFPHCQHDTFSLLNKDPVKRIFESKRQIFHCSLMLKECLQDLFAEMAQFAMQRRACVYC